jgi:hypothetical protein
MTKHPSPELGLSAPGVTERQVTPEFVVAVSEQVNTSLRYLAGETDDIPFGFVQKSGAYTPGGEAMRDYFIEQFSEQFAAGTYGFDEVLTRYEVTNAANNAAGASEQPDGSHPNSVTLKLEPWMKQRLEFPEPYTEAAVPGSIIRRIELPGSDAGRSLRLFEVEVPRPDDDSHDMARMVFFVK